MFKKSLVRYSSFFLEFQFFDFFPAELRITEMSVAGCLGIDRFAQIKFLQDIADFEIKVSLKV